MAEDRAPHRSFALYAEGRVVANPSSIREAAQALAQAHSDPAAPPFLWADLLHPGPDELGELAECFDLHPLAVEDAVEAHQRPKYEHYGTTDFMVLRPVASPPPRRPAGTPGDPGDELALGELHLFLGASFIITVRRSTALDIAAVRDVFDDDPRFLEHAQFSALYRILDRVVDDYEPALRALEDDADVLEERLFGSGPIGSQEIYRLSRDLIELDRAINPLAAVMGAVFAAVERHTVPPDLARGLRDVADHVHTATDRIERLRSLLREIFTVNATLISERQNEDMRAMNELSIQQNDQMKKISAWAGILFFPSLVAGTYGMNFQHMPELHWLLGYPFALGLMLLGCVVLHRVFTRVGWL
ncbi:magnesium and cobalt transport protein CorA [Brevibacterium ihuae]|uniref:magnesium and cobalt transport protein CorA n=1 Tax=Brevibacterium ihuae TaxID=1631743 RepID=UPI0015E0B41A|nr:magnesium and cobalt transport protein CorA [Brevibacterium ihuae]